MTSPGRVLIVEDDVYTRLLLQAIVARHRFEPVIAVDGRSAQALLATSRFDAILLDLRLPEVDGGTILRELDRDSIHRVVVVTAAPPTEWRRHLDDGVWGVIQKPFDVSELESVLLACLDGDGDGDGAPKKIAGDQPAKRAN
jgi:DNA-binding response OmpR family regulator